VDGKRADDNFAGFFVPFHRVESVLADLADEINGTIALPVSSNNAASLSGGFDHRFILF